MLTQSGVTDTNHCLDLVDDRHRKTPRSARFENSSEIQRPVWLGTARCLLGGVAPTADHARQMIKRGYSLLMIGFDWALLQRGIAAALDGMR